MELTREVRAFDPEVDTLIVRRPLTLDGKTLEAGSTLPLESYTPLRLDTLIRTRLVTIQKGYKPLQAVAVSAPVAPVAAKTLSCTVCGREGFKLPVNLGAHMRSHNKKK